MFKRLLTDSFNLVFGNLEMVFRACGAWFVLQLVLFFAAAMILESPEPIQQGIGYSAAPENILFSLVGFAFALVSSASIAVAWHRFGLIGDYPDLIHLKVGRVEGQFILKSLLISLLAMCTFLVLFLLLSVIFALFPDGMGQVFSIICGVAAAIFAAPHFMRLYIALPATAIERPMGLKEAHAAGYGLGWSMVGTIFVLSLPILLVSIGLQFLINMAGGGLPLLFIQFKTLILNLLLQMLITVLGISVITAGYRAAMERQGQNRP